MQALTVHEGRLTYHEAYPEPLLQPGEARIRPRLMGICSTDLEIIRGYAPLADILGHEFVGDVVEVADAADAHWIGRRVVGTINIGCRTCAVCLTDGPEHCPRRTVLGIINRPGVFSGEVALPVANLLAVPDAVTDEAAVFTEPLAAALRIRQQLRLSPTDRVAVVGPGRLGLLVGQVLALDGSEVTLLGRSTQSLSLPERLGLATGFVSDAADNSFDLVVEATGNEQGLSHSLRLVRPRGTLVLKSTFAGEATVNLTKLVVAEVTVVGSRCGPFAPALRLLAEGRIDVRSTIDGRYPLAAYAAAFAHAARPGVRKILLTPL